VTFSPPFLHPLSLRTKSPRSYSPFPTSAKRSKDGQKPRTRFTINSSPPNSPVEPLESKHIYPIPKPASSPFTIRGFLALSTFSKLVAILFGLCVFLLLRAFLGIGHSAESCGVYAHDVTRPGSPPGSSTPAPEENDFESRTTYEGLYEPGEDQRRRVWLKSVQQMYGYQHDWKLGEYEVDHDDEEGDRYDDEYEHEDFLDY